MFTYRKQFLNFNKLKAKINVSVNKLSFVIKIIHFTCNQSPS